MGNKRDNIDLIVSASELTAVFDKKSSLNNLLHDITVMVSEHMNADVCSIYLYDEPEDQLILRATVGLSESSVGKVKLKNGEGITGTALKELRPIREARAATNPAFKLFKDIDEEKYEAFLAVPIKKGLSRIGVITLQHKQPDYFTRRDTSALKAIASQLAASIANSQFLMNLGEKQAASEDVDKLTISGTGEGSSVVLGKAFILNRRQRPTAIAYDELTSEEQIEGCADPDESDMECIALDTAAFDGALELSMSQLEELQDNTDDSLSDVAGMIFTAHFLMLRDEHFTGEMRRLITTGIKPDEAVKQVASRYAGIFSNSDVPGIREKIQDVRDLEHRLLANLYGQKLESADYSSNIVIAENVFPSELVKIWLQKAKGLIMFGSGMTAHISILARSLGLPLLLSSDRRLLSVADNTRMLLDAGSGHLYVNPSEEIETSYRAAVRQSAAIDVDVIPDKTVTADGVELRIQANINIIHDVVLAREMKAEGIGLYRSEFPFLIRNEFPSEEEQYRIYSKILQRNGAAECVFRTLDIGGDKMPGYASDIVEANPFLGFRGIRFSLGHPEIFQDQIRAMLRAGAERDLKIMFPMVSSLDEFIRARHMVIDNIKMLKAEGVPHNSSPGIGAMVELPAAVEIIPELSAAADFLSIGTNDLVMYTLAVDRTNEHVRSLYRPWHPAILRSLKKVADQAAADDTELSVCGEAAAEPSFFKFLMGLGIRKFSIDPHKIPGLKTEAGRLNSSDCVAFSGKALAAGTVEDTELLFV